jgi:hypothetical protein
MSDEQPPKDDAERSPWWRLVEAEVERRQDLESDGDLDDPWADAGPATPALTAEQRDRLAGLDDQPGVARLAGMDRTDDAGDGEDQPGVARLDDAHRQDPPEPSRD